VDARIDGFGLRALKFGQELAPFPHQRPASQAAANRIEERA
jgi:hypothetical protein